MPRFFRSARFASAIALAVLSLPAFSANAVDKLTQFLDGLDSFEAHFVQTIETDSGIAGPFGGMLYVERPGRFRWEYEGDEGQLIVADGRRVWLLDRQLEQVSHQSQEAALRGTPAQLLVEADDFEQFFVAVDGGELDGQDWVELTPRDEESQFDFIRVAFDGDDMSRLEMSDKFGQYTRFAFADARRNPALDGALFEFEAPAGWDVFQTH